MTKFALTKTESQEYSLSWATRNQKYYFIFFAEANEIRYSLQQIKTSLPTPSDLTLVSAEDGGKVWFLIKKDTTDVTITRPKIKKSGVLVPTSWTVSVTIPTSSFFTVMNSLASKSPEVCVLV